MADLVAFDDLDPLGSECATPLDELEQDLWHRLNEEYGSNPDDGDRGVGIENWLKKPFQPVQLQRAIEIDFRKDPRVDSVTATVTAVAGVSETYQVSVAVDADSGQLNMAATLSTSGLVAS